MKILRSRFSIWSAGLFGYLMLFATTACSTQEGSPAPQAFWTEFRQAVLANDTRKLMSMTSFPLEVRGVDDSQPARQYPKEQFETIFKKILEQPVVTMEGERIVMNTTKDVVGFTETVTRDHRMTAESFRIDQLVFELRHKQWRLVRAYLEE